MQAYRRYSRAGVLGIGRVLITLSILTGCQTREPTSSSAPPVPLEAIFPVEQQVPLVDSFEDPIAEPVAVVPWQDRLVVVDLLQANVKVFDHQGDRILTLGRAGDGPGEFRTPTAATEVAGGELAVFDPTHQRVSFFSADGSYRDSWKAASSAEGSFTSAQNGERILLAGEVASEAWTDTPGRHGLHMFTLAGERVRSFGGRPETSHLYQANINTLLTTAFGSTVVAVERTSNVVDVHDLQRDTTWRIELRPSFYRPHAWRRVRFNPDEEMNRLREWANKQMWISRIVFIDSTMIAVAFTTVSPRTDRTLHQYVITRLDGRVLSTTLPTEWSLYFSSDDRVYGGRRSDDGNLEIRIYRKPDLSSPSDTHSIR